MGDLILMVIENIKIPKNYNYAGHIFIFEHIVSRTLLGSLPALCDQGKCLTFLSRSL
jgi:hypothetical protein